MIPIRNLYTHLHRSRPFRYIFIGGISYIIELATLLFLATILLLSPEISVALSFWVGLVVSFLLQKYIAFSNRKNDKRTIGKQTAAYGVLVVFNYCFTILFVGTFADIAGLVAARTVALLFTVSWNYFVYKRVFGQ